MKVGDKALDSRMMSTTHYVNGSMINVYTLRCSNTSSGFPVDVLVGDMDVDDMMFQSSMISEEI